MKKLTQLEKFGLMAGVIVAMSFFYMNKMYDPQAKALEKTIKELNKITEELNALKNKTSEPVAKLQKRKKAKDDEFEKITKELDALSLKSGTPEGMIEIEGNIYDAALESGMWVNEVKPVDGEKEKDKLIDDDLKDVHAYDFIMSGTHAGFVMFLERLKAFPDPVKIERITLMRDKAEGMVKIGFTLKI